MSFYSSSQVLRHVCLTPCGGEGREYDKLSSDEDSQPHWATQRIHTELYSLIQGDHKPQVVVGWVQQESFLHPHAVAAILTKYFWDSLFLITVFLRVAVDYLLIFNDSGWRLMLRP
jgi:hypothetical protein